MLKHTINRLDESKLPAWMTAEQLAAWKGVCVANVRTMARTGAIPAHKIGRLWRFSRDDLKEWDGESKIYRADAKLQAESAAPADTMSITFAPEAEQLIERLIQTLEALQGGARRDVDRIERT